MPQTMTFEVADRVARITLDRPDRGNGITRRLVRELAECVERADLDPAVHVLLLSGNGKGSAAAMTSSRAPRATCPSSATRQWPAPRSIRG